MNHLVIEYANPNDLQDCISVQFRLVDNPVTPLWVKAVQDAQARNFPIDDPRRFYGFGSFAEQEADAIARINQCCDTINSHERIVERRLTSITDQDTLNYLHHIFEVYHGLLNKQHHRFWLTAPASVRKALSDLNIAVHRCEGVAAGNNPMHVLTWFGLPKDRFLSEEHYQHFTLEHEFGTVLLNYVEVGKTIANLCKDNDQYIEPGAFQPFKHYSADVVVKFWATDPLQINQRRVKVQQYYEEHRDFFGEWQTCYTDGTIPVAVIDQVIDLDDLKTRQYVKSVSFI